MRSIAFSGAIAAVVMLISPAAHAADIARPVYKAPPAPVATYSWTGFYVGGHVGYGWDAKTTSTLTPANAATEAFVGPPLANGDFPNGVTAGGDGWLGGVQAGYNWQVNNVVFGIEADFSWTGIGDTVTITNGFSVNTYSSDVNWFGTVRGRLGLLTAPNILIYGTGGFAYAEVDQSMLVRATLNGDSFGGSNSSRANGWTVGGGLEYALGNNWSLKGEYLYVNLEPKNYTTSTFAAGCTATNCLLNIGSGDIEMHIVRAGINYKFDWGKGPVMAKY